MSTPTPPALDRDDPLGLDASLSSDEIAVRDTVRRFCAEHVTPHVAAWFEDGDLPVARDLAKQFGELGLLGMQLHGHGCGGASAVHYGLACRELEAADSGIRSLVSVQGSLAMFAIASFGSDEQKRQWLPGMATGDLLGCFGLTEPDVGSDPAAMKTRARRDGPDWVITGGKMWITNGSVADVAIVWAATDDGIRGFIVPTDTPGFTANTIGHKLSLRASITSELVLDNVRLPADAMLPGATGLRAPLACLSEARYGIVWGAMGAARSAWQCALDYARQRTQFGRPIAGFQLTQAKLVDMAVELHKGQLLSLHLGRPTCFEQNDGYSYGLGIVISGHWLLQNPMFAGYAAVEAYLPSQRVAVAVAVTYAPEAFDDQGNYRNQADILFRKIGAEVAPNDAPPMPPGR